MLNQKSLKSAPAKGYLACGDIEKNLRAVLPGIFAKLRSRHARRFDVQQAVLLRT